LSDYSAPDATRMLDFTRKDRYGAFDLTVAYAITRNLSVRGEALVSRNLSNDTLFEYDRNTLAFKIRYEFN
jgi:hypothetical protein